MSVRDCAVIIPAAGMGERLGMGPKAFLPLHGRQLIDWVSHKALKIAEEVIVALPAGHSDALEHRISTVRYIEGGSSRQETVAKLVAETEGGLIAVADVARPFYTASLLHAVLDGAAEHGVAGAFRRPDVPVAVIEDGKVLHDLDRTTLGVFQAPQAFQRELLLQLLELAEQRQWLTQATVQLAIKAGMPVHAVEGEKNNLKLTTREDWLMAQSLVDFLA